MINGIGSNLVLRRVKDSTKKGLLVDGIKGHAIV